MIGRKVGIIERAHELALQLANVEAIRLKLRKEGYSDVDAHLMGKKIRSDLVKVIRREAGARGDAANVNPHMLSQGIGNHDTSTEELGLEG